MTISGNIAGQQNKTGTDRAVISMAVADLTFRATEDLGGGLKATGFFTIENMNTRGRTATRTSSGVDAGGAGTSASTDSFNTNGPTNADSGLSLAGNFGSIAFSNTRSTNLAANANVFGTSITNGFYETVDSRPNIQAISYTSPALVPGLNVSLAQVNVGDAASSQVGKISVIGASYANGPFSLGAQQKNYNASATASGASNKRSEGFAKYNLGVAVIGLGFGSKITTTGKAMTSYGLSVPMGNITFGYEGAVRDAAKFNNYGVRYDFSKRTTVHLSAGQYQTTATNSLNQSRIRLSHTF